MDSTTNLNDDQRGRRLARYARDQIERQAVIFPFRKRFEIPPDILHGYALQTLIGNGGQGTVYEGIQTITKRRVAIKLLNESVGPGNRSKAKFEREIEALGRLKHPNIVTVHDGGVSTSGRFYIVMDLVSGVPINHYLAEVDASIEESLRLFAKVCDAVHAAHVQGVVHRDLKPGNILVDSRGEPHILDFGLAKLLDDAREEPFGPVIGSAAWASPEQARGANDDIDPRTDVYSLGAVFFDALCGVPPFTFLSPSNPRRPSDYWNEIDDDIDTIILKCLRRHPEKRYQTASELGRDFERRLRREPIAPKRHLRRYVLGCAVRRHKMLTTTVTGVFILLLAFALTVTVLYRRESTAKLEASAQRSRAEAALRDLQNTASAVVTKLGPKLTKLPQSAPIRKELLETALAAFGRLMAHGSDDPVILADMAKDLVQLSDMAVAVDRREDAMRYRLEAQGIYEKLLSTDVQNVDWRRGLALCSVLVGDLLAAKDDQRERRRLYEETRAIDETLGTQFPDNLSIKNDLLFDYERLGTLSKNEGDDETASRLFERQYELAKLLVERNPDSGSSQWALLCSLGQRAAMHQRRGEAAELAELNLRSLAVARRLNEIEPDRPEYMKALFSTAGSVVADQMGKDQPAQPDLLFEVEPILKKYVQLDPENHDRQRDLASHYLSLCGVYQNLHDWNTAETYAGKALDVLHALPENAQNQVDQLRLVLIGASDFAVLAYRRGDEEASKAKASEAIGAAARLEEKLSDDATTLFGLAELWARCEIPDFCDPVHGESLARRSIEMSQGTLPRSFWSLAIALEAQGRIDEARDAANTALSMLPVHDHTLRVGIEQFLGALHAEASHGP